MEEGGGGGGGERPSRAATSYEAVGGRQRFTIELRPGETTIVSWKKLLKDAGVAPQSDKTNQAGGGAASSSVAPASVPVHPSLDSRLAPGQPVDGEAKDGPTVNRLSNVIEKIERLYVGNQSDDDEDLNDIPDEDQYDTEDSFIDDTELDEYFQVDNSEIKHDGFFVNRGKLERITSEPTAKPNQQPKKRRRKDLAKSHEGTDGGHNMTKHVKPGKKGKSAPYPEGTSILVAHSLAVPNAHAENIKPEKQIHAPEVSLKEKAFDAKIAPDPSPLGPANSDAILQEKTNNPQKTGVLPSKNLEKSQSGRPSSNADGLDQSIQWREKGTSHDGRSDTKIAEGKTTMQPGTVPLVQKREGSSSKPKSTMLDKAIRDLEKIVAESRPPNVEVQDGDNSSQSVKRRLPTEIKQKLAKVARLAQASQGKISKELINRLMSILGHLIQLQTLKRNLKIMVSMGLSAKQEKDVKVQQLKKEVIEMVKLRIPLLLKELEQLACTSDDFQETTTEKKEAFRRKYKLDEALEDKICDLYELFVEGLDEDAGPQVRKLYAELAALWPNGFMDNHGIKRAICRAKDRRRALSTQNKDLQKIKRNKLLAAKRDMITQAATPVQPQHVQERSVPGISDFASISKPVSATTSTASARIAAPTTNGNIDLPKHEKVKEGSAISSSLKTVDGVPKKKVKRKAEWVGEATSRLEKMTSTEGEERHKSHKQAAVPLPKSNIQQVVHPSFEQQG